MNSSVVDYQQIIQFWFEEIDSTFWFKKDDHFDQTIRDRFLSTWTAAIQNELYLWRKEPEGRLAEIIILDQFSRNMFRDSREAFKYDPLALCLTLEAIKQNIDQKLSIQKRKFIYMPLMHSESLVIHDLALELFDQPGLEDNLIYEKKHCEIIKRFGRYPHRNQILGRTSTAEELAFLTQPGSSF